MKSFLLLLIRLFPAGFRRQFGPDVRAQVETDFERARKRGSVQGLVFTVAAGADLLWSAMAERWDPTWVDHAESITMRDGVGMMIDRWMKEFRLALRALRRAPGFAAVAVLTLALAIGANAGIFSVVDAVLLEPLPFTDSDRLVRVLSSAPGSDFPEEFGPSMEFYVHYAENSEMLEDVAAYQWFTNTMRVDDRTERVPLAIATPSLFATLGVTPMIGRLPTVEDEGDVAVISHAAWSSWFGRDPSIVGRSAYIGGGTRTIIGVMGPDFWFPNDEVLAWLPWVIRTEDIRVGRFGVPLVARLSPDATADQAVDELNRLARQLPELYDGSVNYAPLMEKHRALVRPLMTDLVGDVSSALWVLLASMGIVLLIACANVANLFLVRAEHRQQDLAVRRALGAARGDLIRIQLAEAFVIAAMAGVAAVALAWLTVPLYVRAAPQGVPRLSNVGMSLSTLAFTLGAAVLTAAVIGFLPAIRSSMPNLTRLRDAGRGSTARQHWVRNGLVVGQTALALVLLIGSGLLIRSFVALRGVDPGYETENIFSFQFAPERDDLVDGPTWAAFHLDFMDRLRAMPSVESVGVVENLPLNEGVGSSRLLTEETNSEGAAGAMVYQTFAGGDYFSAMGIGVVRGRAFQRSDHVSDLGNVLLSASAAVLMFPGDDPVGKRVTRRDSGQWETVVGVVEDVLQYGFRDDPQPMIYFPLVGQQPNDWRLSTPAYVIKTDRAEIIAPEIREMIREVAPSAPMYRVYTMAGLARDSMLPLSFTMLTLGLASMLALALGAIGLFGVLSYAVTQRTQEIGLRMALGAEAERVQRMVVAQGARVVVIGVVLGTGAAVLSTKLLEGLLFGVEAVDPSTYVGMATAMLGVGLLASYLPARRASHVNPIESLRGE